MTNFEYCKDEILELVKDGSAIAVSHGNVCACAHTPCEDCDFGEEKDLKGDCRANKVLWLYAEHAEQPKLTKKERIFCELVETGWIVKNKNGLLFWFKSMPSKVKNEWCAGSPWRVVVSPALGAKFRFVKWEDEEPWTVEDLLKLEVEE